MTVPAARDWRVILLAVGGAAGALLCLATGAAVAGYTVLEPWLTHAAPNRVAANELTPVFVLSGGMALVGAVLFVTVLASIRALRGSPQDHLQVPPLRWWVVLIWVGIWLAASAMAQQLQDDAALSWAIPILHLVAIASPLYLITRLAIAGIRGGSELRLWGALSSGLLLGTGVAAAVEIFLLLVALVAGVAYVMAHPGSVIALERLASQVSQVATREEAVELLGPIFMNPLAVVLVMAMVSVASPLVEEVAKSVPVWSLYDRISNGPQGFWSGALSGAGFGLLEGVMVSADAGEGSGFILILRAGSSLMHVVAAGLAGWGIGAFRGSHKARHVVAGYAGAMLIHALWNGIIVLIGYGGIRMAYGSKQPDVPGLAFSIVGGSLMVLLIGALPIALLGLNRILRTGSPLALEATTPVTNSAPPTEGDTKVEAS